MFSYRTIRNVCFSLGLGLILCATGAVPVYAQTNDVNDVNDALWQVGPIPALAKNRDLVLAKQESIYSARFKAFTILMQRIVNPGDLSSLDVPDNEVIALFERSRQIKDERFGGDQYSASLSFDFLPGSVDSYLQGLGITPTIKAPDSLLVITDGINLPRGAVRDTLWREVFEYQDPAMFIGNPIVQSAEMDTELLARLRLGDNTVFDYLKDVYAVDAVMVASLDLGGSPYRLRLQHNRDGLIKTVEFNLLQDQLAIDLDGLLNLRARIESFWRQSWFLRAPDTHQEDLTIPIIATFNTIEHFINLRDILIEIPRMRNVIAIEVTLISALGEITYSGSHAELQRELSVRGITHTPDATASVWRLALP